MLEVNMRGDGASRFPRNQRWGYFPSVSVGWNIAQESFWQPLYQVWNYFKLRGSYGQLGNQNTESFYPYFQSMSTNAGNVVLGGNQVSVLPVFPPYSTEITWEKIENAGAGIDFGFLNSRLMGSFDWYQRTTKDMVGPAASLPGVFGGDAPRTNNAELRVRGWEFEIAWRDRIGKDFSYGISGSLSDFSSIVTRYDSSDGQIGKYYKNKHYGDIWGYLVEGIAKNDREMADYLAVHDQSAIGNNWGGGDLMYKNLDDDPAINAGARTLDDHGDLTVIGRYPPLLL